MEINTALQTIGLNEKESTVYVTLLQLGRTSAYVVARKSGLKNPTTYVILDQLIEKGLARKVPRARKQLYSALPPKEMFLEAEEKLAEAKKELPKLLAMTKGKPEKVNTIYFEGENGVRDALNYKLKEHKGGELVGFYAVADNTSEKMMTTSWEWANKLKKLGITVRGYTPKHKLLEDFRKVDKKYGRELREIPFEKYSSETSLDVIGDMVRIIDITKLLPQAVIIENERIAKMIKQIFELTWEKDLTK